VGDLKNMSYNYLVRTADDALKARLVDKKGYYDEFLTMIRAKMGLKNTDKINSLTLSEYAQHYEKKSSKSKDKIAVVYAEGDIDYNDQQETDGVTEGLRYAKIIRKIRQDKNVKAIVLRVNSGGGSSIASDIIWRELDLAKKEGKVVVSSFGDFAASGGYYIAMASDAIYAEKNCLTGSIGVFGAIPSIQATMKNKLGINFDTVKTGKYTVAFGATFDHTPEEGKILQVAIDSIYEQFLQRVSTNRKMSRDQVHAIAQGRVWLASKAKEIGLVDEIGGLNDAIAAAASKAGLTDFKKVEYPKFKSGIEKFMENLTGDKSDDIAKTAIKAEMGEFYNYYEHFKKMKEMKGPQMRLPYYIKVK
jgi:protease-4